MMEIILQETLVQEDEEGNRRVGFADLDEIGGEFDPSEAFNVDISTDEEGHLNPLNVSFDSPDRPTYHKMYLDSEKLTKLREYYEQLHSTEEQVA